MKTKSLIILLLISSIISCTSKSKARQESKAAQQVDITTQLAVVELNHKNIWGEVDKKSNYFKSNLKPEKDLNKLPEEFMDFSNKFITDSLFQYQHIDFKYLVGAIGECDSTIILTAENWRHSNWDFIKEFSEGNEYEPSEKWDNDAYISNDKIYFEFVLKEIGLIYQIGFEKINGDWHETLYKIDAC